MPNDERKALAKAYEDHVVQAAKAMIDYDFLSGVDSTHQKA